MPTIIQEGENGWFVVRTRPKSEHLAESSLKRYADVDEVFAPRIKYEKGTRRGKVWFIEALFPGYIFARFDLAEKLRMVNSSNAVAGVLRFNDLYPQISDGFIRTLQAEFPQAEEKVRVIHQPIEVGSEVVVVEGVMAGLETIVTRVLSGKERVRILLNWLGEEREAEVCYRSIVPVRSVRESLT